MSSRCASILCLGLILVLVAAWGFGTSESALRAAPFSAADTLTELRRGAANYAANPVVAPGEPGLSFRYMQAFGEYATAYFADTVHLNYPEGVATDGTALWIAEGPGVRLLGYAGDGSFVTAIGQAGNRWGIPGTQLRHLTDAAIDGDGNIWLADANAHHVTKLDASGNHLAELGMLWEAGTGNDRFHLPAGIALDSKGNVYVSDGAGSAWSGGGGNHRVQIFTPTGAYLNTIGVTGVPAADNSHFNGPVHIFIDATDRLYVADAWNHRVQIYNVSAPAAPVYVATLGVSGEPGTDSTHLRRPAGVAVNATAIYVADMENHRVQIFDLATRAYSTTLGTGKGTGTYQFDTPTDVAIDAAGNIYVADMLNQRVMQYNPDLVYQRTYGVTGVPYLTDDLHYFNPSAVAPTSDGGSLILEENGHRLVKLSDAAAPEWTLGEAGRCDVGNDHLCLPRDAVVGPDGRIFVADTWNHRVQVLDAAGQYQETVGTGQGNGPYEFDAPGGVAVGSDGKLYVADTRNHRVQVYSTTFSYVATIGVTGVAGSDALHLNLPFDVEVDSAGRIYVVDHANHRVQVFGSDGTLLLTLGVPGECGGGFTNLCLPTAVDVDAVGRIYVADQWGDRILVFDAQGALLTSLGNSWGSGTGALNHALGLAVDDAGYLYVPEYLAHRVKVFAPGVPGWRQVNVNAFGDADNWAVGALEGFGAHLYAGTYNSGYLGAQLHRMDTSGNWTMIIADGFGPAQNVGINRLFNSGEFLYAATDNAALGAEMWRSSNGLNWTRVISGGFGDRTNGQISSLGSFSNTLYAATARLTSTLGAEVWRSSSGKAGTWGRIVANGFGDANTVAIPVLEEINGYFYAGTSNSVTGGQVWRSPTGDMGSWTPFSTGGFGNASNITVSCLGYYDGYLYAGTHNSKTGAEIWRSTGGTVWTQAIGGGLGEGQNTNRVDALMVYAGELHAVTSNADDGLGVWRTHDGVTWAPAIPAGFGLHDNMRTTAGGSAVTLFRVQLYLGTTNILNGGQIWMSDAGESVYLPLVTH